MGCAPAESMLQGCRSGLQLCRSLRERFSSPHMQGGEIVGIGITHFFVSTVSNPYCPRIRCSVTQPVQLEIYREVESVHLGFQNSFLRGLQLSPQIVFRCTSSWILKGRVCNESTRSRRSTADAIVVSWMTLITLSLHLRIISPFLATGFPGSTLSVLQCSQVNSVQVVAVQNIMKAWMACSVEEDKKWSELCAEGRVRRSGRTKNSRNTLPMTSGVALRV
jgi:hypothetical protein